MKYMKRILFLLLSMPVLASCDFNAHQIEYEDVIGIYRGEVLATITVSDKQGITLEDGRHLNYGDTLVHTFSVDKELELGISADTDNKFAFSTCISSVNVLGKAFNDLQFYGENLPIAIKGNHIVTWGISDIETPTIDLPIETIYIPVNNLYYNYMFDAETGIQNYGKGYIAVSMANYAIVMDLMVEKAPDLLTPGLTLWLTYNGVMISKDSYNQ